MARPMCICHCVGGLNTESLGTPLAAAVHLTEEHHSPR